MSTCSICHAGFHLLSNPKRHCKDCNRVVCRQCSKRVSATELAQIRPGSDALLTNVIQRNLHHTRLCKSCLSKGPATSVVLLEPGIPSLPDTITQPLNAAADGSSSDEEEDIDDANRAVNAYVTTGNVVQATPIDMAPGAATGAVTATGAQESIGTAPSGVQSAEFQTLPGAHETSPAVTLSNIVTQPLPTQPPSSQSIPAKSPSASVADIASSHGATTCISVLPPPSSAASSSQAVFSEASAPSGQPPPSIPTAMSVSASVPVETGVSVPSLPWWATLALPFTLHTLRDAWATPGAGSGGHPPAAPPATIGHVVVRVVEATGLAAYNLHRLTSAAPSSDAFAEVSVGQHDTTALTTRVIPRSTSPAWDEAFVFAVASSYATVRVTVWHAKDAAAGATLAPEAREPLGEAILPLSLFADQSVHDVWVNLRPCGYKPGEEGLKEIVRLHDELQPGFAVGEAVKGVKEVERPAPAAPLIETVPSGHPASAAENTDAAPAPAQPVAIIQPAPSVPQDHAGAAPVQRKHSLLEKFTDALLNRQPEPDLPPAAVESPAHQPADINKEGSQHRLQHVASSRVSSMTSDAAMPGLPTPILAAAASNMPPITTSDAVVHDYGLGRLHLRVQLCFDPVAECWSHWTHFERPPPKRKPAYSVALLVHNAITLYSEVTPVVKPVMTAIANTVSWRDPKAAMFTILVLCLWTRYTGLVPILAHLALLIHLLSGYVRLQIAKRADAVNHLRYPSVVSAATSFVQPVDTQVAYVDPIRQEPVLVNNGSSSFNAVINENGTDTGAVSTSATTTVGLLSENEHIEPLMDAIADSATGEPSLPHVERRGRLSRLKSMLSNCWRNLVARLHTISKKASSLVARVLSAVRAKLQGKGMSTFSELLHGTVRDPKGWQKILVALGMAASFLLVHVRDSKSTNRSFQQSQYTQADSRRKVRARLGLMDPDDLATEEIKVLLKPRLTPNKQLVAVGEPVTSAIVPSSPVASSSDDREEDAEPKPAPFSRAVALPNIPIPSDATLLTTIPLIPVLPGSVELPNTSTAVPAATLLSAGLEPLRLEVSQAAKLICVNNRTILHDPSLLARAAAVLDKAQVARGWDSDDEQVSYRGRRGSSSSTESVSGVDYANNMGNAQTGLEQSWLHSARHEAAADTAAAVTASLLGPDAASSQAIHLATQANKKARHRQRLVLVAAALADHWTPGKPTDTLQKIQNGLGDAVSVLRGIKAAFEWSNTAVTAIISASVFLSLLLQFVVPQRYMLLAVALFVMVINTTAFQYIVDLLQGYISYQLGSLTRAERGAHLTNRWASPAANRAALIARFDVLSDVVADGRLLPMPVTSTPA